MKLSKNIKKLLSRKSAQIFPELGVVKWRAIGKINTRPYKYAWLKLITDVEIQIHGVHLSVNVDCKNDMEKYLLHHSLLYTRSIWPFAMKFNIFLSLFLSWKFQKHTNTLREKGIIMWLFADKHPKVLLFTFIGFESCQFGRNFFFHFFLLFGRNSFDYFCSGSLIQYPLNIKTLWPKML